MIKVNEASNPNSCWNRAEEHEMVFVLLARDAAAPTAIRAWCDERVRLDKNNWHDKQIIDAMECARQMELQRRNTTTIIGGKAKP